MIEGCRLWPWVGIEARKNDEAAFMDCETCMERNNRQTRQHLTCGYEPRLDDEYRGWFPPDGKIGFRQNAKTVRLPTVCPGYTTKLPQVIEIARAHRHWKNGQLGMFAPDVSEALLFGIEIIDSEINAAQSFEMTPEKDGGGRK